MKLKCIDDRKMRIMFLESVNGPCDYKMGKIITATKDESSGLLKLQNGNKPSFMVEE